MESRPAFSNPFEVMDSWPEFCHHLFKVATESVHPSRCLPNALAKLEDTQPLNVIAAGKGAFALGEALLDTWQGKDVRGLAIGPTGHAISRNMTHVKVMHATHPVPSSASVAAGQAALMQAASTKPDELLFILLTGGASALMCYPSEAVSLYQKQNIIETLLRKGASIETLNTVRRSLSMIKGGGLLEAASHAKHIETLVISDVVGDDPALIGSGPTIARTKSEVSLAKEILKEHAFSSDLIKPYQHTEVPKSNRFQILASASTALEAASQTLKEAGFETIILGSDIEGEARDVAQDHAALINEALKPTKIVKPIAFLSGGELTVTVNGSGVGGPNQEYCLSLMQEFGESPDLYCVAFDTDGADGFGGAAGAFVSPAIGQRARSKRIEPLAFLRNNDSAGFFQQTGGQLVTGPSGTNVNDVRVVCWFPDE